MKLYFSPMTCSLATRISLYEGGIGQRVEFLRVALRQKTLEDGSSYLAVAERGQVPTLRLENGELLSENAAILQYVGDQAAGSGLTPPAGTLERYQLQQWLSFVGTELHKHIFYTIFNPASPQEARDYVKGEPLGQRFGSLARHLEGREFLVGDRFSVADAYLVTVLNWCSDAEIDLGRWPTLVAYHQRHLERPAVQKAMAVEYRLYQEVGI